MDKKTAIEIFLPKVSPNISNILAKFIANANKFGRLKTKIVFTYEDFINLICKKEYNLLEIGISPPSVAKFLKEAFPDRCTIEGTKVCSYILTCSSYKHCCACMQVKPLAVFRKNSSRSDGLNVYCKICHLSQTTKTQPNRQAIYRASKNQRVVSWTEHEKIASFYAQCPTGYHVDHIVPLNGTKVSGLHVLNNLQYLLASDNTSKSNKFDI